MVEDEGDLHGQLRIDLARGRQRVLHLGHEGCSRRVALERDSTGEHLVGDDPKRIKVRGGATPGALPPLWGHGFAGGHHLAGDRVLLYAAYLGETEIAS